MDSKNNSPSHNWVVATQIFGEDEPIWTSIFFKGVGSTTNQIIWVSFGLSPFSVGGKFEVSLTLESPKPMPCNCHPGGGSSLTCFGKGRTPNLSRWWFQIFLHVHPYLGKIPIDESFSNGLKPPTSYHAV